MNRIYCLSAQNCDEISNHLGVMFDRALAIRGLLALYVTESEFMVPINVNKLANIIWDLTEDFCDLMAESCKIVNATEPMLVVDENEGSNDDGSE